MSEKEMVNHPAHYGGSDNPYEAIKVIEAWSRHWGGMPHVAFSLGSALKYISRVGKKGATKEEMKEDLLKASWYLRRAAEQL